MRGKRLLLTVVTVLFLATAFVAGKGPQGASSQPPASEWPDSLHSVWLYTEAIKHNVISGDTAQARQLLLDAIHADTNYAPAYFALSSGRLAASADEAVSFARRAWELDTANLWYERNYGQALLMAGRYGEALERYRRLVVRDPKDPDNFRLLAALYDQQRNPYMALATLDSAELRFGRIPYLLAVKRRLLIATNQIDKAIDEARRSVADNPYDPENRIILASLYGMAKRDSLALAEYDSIFAIDSANVEALMSLSDFYNDRMDYRSLLAVNQKLFQSEEMPVEDKVKRFKLFTTDVRFYREYYPQLHTLASTLAIRHPKDPSVVELYADHLIQSGELDQALAFFKLHLHDTPPQKSYYQWVLDIESYKQRPDSVDRYVREALELFPEEIDFRIAQGSIHTYSGDYDQALRIYRETLPYAQNDTVRSTIWGIIGDIYHSQAEKIMTDAETAGEGDSPRVRKAMRKQMKSCYDAYDRSLRYNDDNVLVLNNYAYFLSLDGEQLDRALRMSERAVELASNNPTYLDTQAWVLFRMGRTAEAKRIMQQAIALDGHNSTELLVHYGDILHALGEHFVAESYWRKALEKGYDAQAIERRIRAMQEEKERAKQP